MDRRGTHRCRSQLKGTIEDHSPSPHVYPGYVKCYVCGVRMEAIEFLMATTDIDRQSAEDMLAQTPTEMLRLAPSRDELAQADLVKRQLALELWNEAQPLEGTLAEDYLCRTRHINLSALPDYGAASLRFHPHCPFNGSSRIPCVVALRRDAVSDAPVSIHRIALSCDAQKLDRMMLGRGGVIKLWPSTDRLVIGEGIETTLAAATRRQHDGEPLQPAWATAATGVMGACPTSSG